jgi:hypothetical protein
MWALQLDIKKPKHKEAGRAGREEWEKWECIVFSSELVKRVHGLSIKSNTNKSRVKTLKMQSYLNVDLVYGESRWQDTGHRMVLWAWAGPPSLPGLEAMHLCGNKRCLCPAHLMWGTHRQNTKQQYGVAMALRAHVRAVVPPPLLFP